MSVTYDGDSISVGGEDDLADDEPTVWPCRLRPGCGCAGLIDCPGPT